MRTAATLPARPVDSPLDVDEGSLPKILLVNQRQHLPALEQVLKDVPTHLLTASSGTEALALALQHSFALAILDVTLPDMGGDELADQLRRTPSTASTPIIFLGANRGDAAHRACSSGAVAIDTLATPVDPAVLIGKVTLFLELVRARTALEGLVEQRTQALERTASELTRRTSFKALVGEISRALMRLTRENLCQVVEASLDRVGRAIGATRAVVCFPTGSEALGGDAATLVWSADGALTGGPPDAAWHAVVMHAGLTPWWGPTLADLREPSARAAFARQALESLLVLPAVEAEQARCAVVFAWGPRVDGRQRGSADLTELLALIPELVYGALLRASAEARREVSDAQHRLLFETMDDGVIYADAQGLVLAVNPVALQLLPQCTPRSNVGEWSAVHQDGTAVLAEALPPMIALRTGQRVDDVTLGVPRNDQEGCRWLKVRSVPLFRHGEDLPYQVYTTFSDQTELHRATDERERFARVEAESRAKSRFLASMSHELRTPMNVVLGYTQLLLREKGLTARQREYLETIGRSGEQLVCLVNNVLDMASSEAGTDAVSFTQVDLAALLDDLGRTFGLRATEKHLRFEVERKADVPRSLLLDAGKVRQVVSNLVGNALKFTEAGEVMLRTSLVARHDARARIAIEVEDTGVGVPPERLADLFEPFVRHSGGKAAVGAGLGLAVCRRFARLMGGDVSVANRPGGGASFRFEFEAEVLSRELVDPQPARVVGLATGSPVVRVLLVEDDGEARARVASMLRNVGLWVCEVADAAAATAIFEKDPCDLVITDLQLAGADGLEVVARIRELPGGRSVPVVVVSATAMGSERERALSAGVDGFMSRPVQESGVLSMIGALTPARFLVSCDQRVPEPPVTAELLASVGADHRLALLKALKSGYADAITLQVEAIAAAVPAVGPQLRRLAAGFEYQKMMLLLGTSP